MKIQHKVSNSFQKNEERSTSQMHLPKFTLMLPIYDYRLMLNSNKEMPFHQI